MARALQGCLCLLPHPCPICTGAEHTWHAIRARPPRTHASPFVGLRSFSHEGSSSVCASFLFGTPLLGDGSHPPGIGSHLAGHGTPSAMRKTNGWCVRLTIHHTHPPTLIEQPQQGGG